MVRLSTLVLSLTAVASSVLGANEETKPPGLCAGKDMFLVEIDPAASLDEVLKPVEAMVTRCKTMDFSLFKGASIQVGEGVDKTAVLIELEKMASVREVSAVESGEGPEVQEQGPATDVDRLHEEGFTGEGVRVALIDTGVDYTHPALGDKIPPGEKPEVADTPMDCRGHGTAVAGILAAQRANNTLGFSGVAPGVSLAVYQAYDDKADIVSISLGVRNAWAGSAMAEAVSRVVARGAHVVVAAGNSGQRGMFGLYSPASARGAVTVANMVSPVVPELKWRATYAVDDGDEVEFDHQVGENSDWGARVSYQLATPSRDTSLDDACDFLSAAPPKDSIILVRDGGNCPLHVQADNVLGAGRRYMMVANNQTALGWGRPGSGNTVSSSAVSAELGDRWMQALGDQKKVTIQLQVVGLHESPSRAAGAVDKTSSWGPDWELNMKPQLGAPGGAVPVPRMGGSFMVESGTSFAAPFVAGVMALITQARGKLEPALMESLLSATARPQRFHDGTGFLDSLAPAAQQGAGLIQAHAALHATTVLTPPSISFNDTDEGRPAQWRSLKIENTGKGDVTYSLSYTPALTVYATKAFAHTLAMFPEEFETVEGSATLRLSRDTVRIAVGQSAIVDVVADPPQGLNARRLPLWSGWITVNASDGSSFSIPYQGVAGSLGDRVVLNKKDVRIATQYNPLSTSVWATPGEVFRFGADPETRQQDVRPVVVVRLRLGVPQLNVSLVRLNTSTSASDNLGPLRGFPARWLPHDEGQPYTWDGTLEDGNLAPEGSYRFEVAVLRIFGDGANDADWVRVLSEEFRIEHR
ncbi:subtilase family protein [Hirsutella rhossiliensis]|uniref:Subtilase family domain-containing protein n=1 Tax=Hirsutella rhossiliensis TaxID=111463 RepID=A0A9P8MYD5_9HYPO|nr:subtilase family domain-containing protein [Hirsutella rhossiliensis]KAH0963247.1 subtilase family domain-containing protein [Hirsutella rhossiliensis]